MKNKWTAGIFLGALLIIIGIIGLFMRSGEFPVNVGNGNEDVVDTDTGRKLPVPALLEDQNPNEGISEFEISVQEGETEFIPGQTTPTLGYNGSYLGPVIKVSRGDEVRMHVRNELSDETSVHWHGLEVEGTADGGPHQVIPEKDIWEPVFSIDQPAATLWFHPHVIGTTAIQVYYGLAGLFIVEDENSKSLNLPDEYGVNDIPLIIQDRSFTEDGSFLYYDNMMDGAYGDYIMVNGAITPYLDVDQLKMRFRIVNGANARNFDLRLSDRSEFQQIASDGGLLESPVVSDSLFITPGERAEIIVDFSDYEEGDVLELISDGELVMTFRVGEEAEDVTEIPEKLAEIERMDPDLVSGFKSIELDGMGHMVTLNGRQFDMDRIDDDVAEGELEIWEISTFRSMMMGSAGHPFHIHGTQFQVLSRNGEEPYQNEKGWKDTIFVQAGETVRILVRFRFKGLFMYHCHILEHEEAGMMGQLEVY
ncbi:multicopper oxidase family protein [Proteiniclasticum aestuarii]|nr:multicopper oxidase domain-containing protein [Proteiniclasticum aestuarii]